MRLIHTRPAQPATPPNNPDFHRTNAQRAAVPDRPDAFVGPHDPVPRHLHEASSEKCGLGAHSGAAKDRRQIWFLEGVGAGQRLAAAEIVDRWRVSEKTARRDIAALKAKGLVAFLGTRRSGGYRPIP